MNYLKVEIPALPQNEGLARMIVAAFVVELDPTIDELTEIKTGVSEAVSNAVIHAYGESGEGIIRIECRDMGSGKVYIAVEDAGIGIADIEKARSPLFTTGKEGERSGMGFTVMESFMDKVLIESTVGKGTRITLIKRLDLTNGL